MWQRMLAAVVGLVLGLGIGGIAGAGQWKWEDDNLFRAEVSYLPEADLKGASGRISAARVLAEGFVPLSGQEQGLMWGLRPRVEMWSLSYEALAPRTLADGTTITSSDMPSRLWSVELAGWGSFQAGTSAYIYAEAGVSLTSDMEDVSSEDMNLIGLAFAGWRISQDLELIAGGGYNQALGRSELYPLLGLRWAFARHWAVDVLLPVHATLRWQFAPAMEAGIEFATNGSYYRLSSAAPWHSAIASWEQMTFGPYAQISLGQAVVRVSAGYSFERKLEIHSDAFNRKLLDYEPDDCLVLALQIFWPL